MGFQSDFLWGAAVSACQYEGAVDADGKGRTTSDVRLASMPDADKLANAVDGYHHIEEDIELMHELGLKSFRFSISWARIIPDGDGDVNEKGIAFYRHILEKLQKYGIEPVVTLLHFDIPYALIEKYEGFVGRRCIDAWERYCRICFKEFGGLVHWWITINEQNVMAAMPAMMGLDPEDPDINRKLVQADYHMYLASAKAVIACHEICPDAKIGPDASYPTFYPATCKPEDIAAAFNTEESMAFAPMEIYVKGIIPEFLLNEWKSRNALPETEDGDQALLSEGKADWLGVNWYCTTTLMTNEEGKLNFGSFTSHSNPYLEYTEWGWSYDPLALRMALRQLRDRFDVPLMICENGWSEREAVEDGKVHDPKRISYIQDHVRMMSQAIEDGVNLIGYQYWSFTDVVSSSSGIAKRYGLVYVDAENDYKRIPKDSFYAYQKIIAANGSLK